MSNGLKTLALTEDDAMKLLVCESHIGLKKMDYQMEHYMFKRRSDGVQIINIRKTWEKLLFAARAIAAIDPPSDVVVVSALPIAQRAVLKFAVHIGATPVVGRFTPGSLTNQIQKNFKEPKLLVVSDPVLDHQAVREASYVNTPVIAFANSDSPLKCVDIAIPTNLKNTHSVGLMWWMLAREVLILRGKITRQTGFIVDDKMIMPDLYFFRDPQEAEKEVAEMETEGQKDMAWGTQALEPSGMDFGAPVEPVKLDLDVPHIQDWAAASDWSTTPAEAAVIAPPPPQQQQVPQQQAPPQEQPKAAPPPQQQPQPAAGGQDDWGSGGTGGW